MIKIIQPIGIETKLRDDILAVKIPKELLPFNDDDFEFFIDTTELPKNKQLDLKKLRESKNFRRYSYFPDGIKIFNKHHFGSHPFFDAYEKEVQGDVLSLIEDANFNTSNLYYFDDSCWMFYGFRKKDPTTRPYHISYIGGVGNDYYDLDVAAKILTKNKWVTDIERVKIPYYNASKERSAAIEFTVQLPQKEYIKLVKYYRDKQKEEFWTCRLKDALSSPHALQPFDILGLSKALKERK